jgi:superfamily II DNA helicase RecQ
MCEFANLSYLVYSFNDKTIMDRMIEQGAKDGRQQLSYEEQQRQKDDLRQVVQVGVGNNTAIKHNLRLISSFAKTQWTVGAPRSSRTLANSSILTNVTRHATTV